jgi:predicted XRE-type DNA-binding protein
MSQKRFANVWDAIRGYTCAALIMALKDHIARTGPSQSEAVKQLDVTQPRIPDAA